MRWIGCAFNKKRRREKLVSLSETWDNAEEQVCSHIYKPQQGFLWVGYLSMTIYCLRLFVFTSHWASTKPHTSFTIIHLFAIYPLDYTAVTCKCCSSNLSSNLCLTEQLYSLLTSDRKSRRLVYLRLTYFTILDAAYNNLSLRKNSIVTSKFFSILFLTEQRHHCACKYR